MNRKSVSIVLAYIALSSALGLSGYLYFDLNKKHAKLQSNYDSLLNKYDLLQSDYQTLNNTHRILVNDYIQLNQTHYSLLNNYTTLELNYTDLSNEYAAIQAQYEGLFNDYNALLEAFNEPLFHEQIPLTYELEEWLATDKTDKIQYHEANFVCGDFAVMLSLHAKLKHWDMGVVAVFGYTESYESFDHAFNVMMCDEGLVYAEPQTDEVWWYENHEEMYGGMWWEFPEYGYIYVEQYIGILLYD
jgi:hypothetical protein